MNTPKSETVKLKLSDIRERCKELLEDTEMPPELRLEDAENADRGSDPYNRTVYDRR